jgi:hypothetical protein
MAAESMDIAPAPQAHGNRLRVKSQKDGFDATCASLAVLRACYIFDIGLATARCQFLERGF